METNYPYLHGWPQKYKSARMWADESSPPNLVFLESLETYAKKNMWGGSVLLLPIFCLFESKILSKLIKNGMNICLSQKMRNVLKPLKNNFLILPIFIYLRNDWFCTQNTLKIGTERFLQTWFRNANQWYPITNWLGGFKPKASGTSGRSAIISTLLPDAGYCGSFIEGLVVLMSYWFPFA